MFYVEIVKTATGEVVKRMGPCSERIANAAENGANINLDHDEFFTRIVPKSDSKENQTCQTT